MSYQDNPMYGRMKQKEAAIRSGSGYAVRQPAYTGVDRAFESDREQRQLQLRQMGSQQKNFDRSLAESARQFNVSQKEASRQFGISLGMAHSKLKFKRKQNRKSEFLGLFNIALGVGTGLTEHMEKLGYMRLQKQMMEYYRGQKNSIGMGA